MHKMKDIILVVQIMITLYQYRDYSNNVICHFQGVVVALESVRLATLLAVVLERLLARELAPPGDHKQTQNH